MIQYAIDQWQPNYTDSFPFSKLITDSFFSYVLCFQISQADDYAFLFALALLPVEYAPSMAKARFSFIKHSLFVRLSSRVALGF